MGYQYKSVIWVPIRHSFSITDILRSIPLKPNHKLACLALAAKMLERRPPSLSEYNIDEDHDFESNLIYETELLVLNALNWKLGSITPFAYLNQFTTNFCLQYKDYNSGILVSTATELIFAIPQEIHLMDFRPSIIAVAAVLAASDDHLTRQAIELKISVIPSWVSLKKEDAFSCYNLMQELKMRKSKTPNSVVLSNNSSSIENSTITPGVRSKRSGSKRRLAYNSPQQHCPPKKNGGVPFSNAQESSHQPVTTKQNSGKRDKINKEKKNKESFS
ncbi:cyclin-D5-1-like isoform X2 [Actinidia eriantha]|uniref:cyclin-D5-1-like isoform X2 n=1 Tax=Actinidia eriantha TaxID=165200 RepID=UPI002584C03B|nr:cyclin-D5-1-like isoform X2 [Actinidia eriantha]